MINKLSAELRQTATYYVNRILTNGLIIDINRNSLVELTISMLLSSFFVLTLIFFKLFYYTSFPEFSKLSF